MKKATAALMLVCFIMSGCASIVGKDSFPMSFQSNPDGSNVKIKDEKGAIIFSGRTPTMVNLTAGESYFHAKSYTVSFSKEGYAEKTIVVKSTMSGWYFGNILFGGFIGLLIVDPLTGKMWKLPDTPIFGNLDQNLAMNKSERSLKFATLDQIPENLRDQLIALK